MNADNQLSTGRDLLGSNLFAYCGSNPVNRIDSTGEAWWHWAIGAGIVAACAIATVVTCGGFAAAATAVCMVGSGMAAGTASATIAAGAFIGSATTFGITAMTAAATSRSVQEFNDKGNWGTVAVTVAGAAFGGFSGSQTYRSQTTPQNTSNSTFLPDGYYSHKKAPKQYTPNSTYINYSYNEYTNKYEKSTAYYDCGGRQFLRIDWTNHGYSDHGNPHVHYTIYNAQFPDGTSIRWD